MPAALQATPHGPIAESNTAMPSAAMLATIPADGPRRLSEIGDTRNAFVRPQPA
jgi:hypothetical protein